MAKTWFDVVRFPDPSTQKIRTCAYFACACEKEGSGTKLYPNAGQSTLVNNAAAIATPRLVRSIIAF